MSSVSPQNEAGIEPLAAVEADALADVVADAEVVDVVEASASWVLSTASSVVSSVASSVAEVLGVADAVVVRLGWGFAVEPAWASCSVRCPCRWSPCGPERPTATAADALSARADAATADTTRVRRLVRKRRGFAGMSAPGMRSLSLSPWLFMHYMNFSTSSSPGSGPEALALRRMTSRTTTILIEGQGLEDIFRDPMRRGVLPPDPIGAEELPIVIDQSVGSDQVLGIDDQTGLHSEGPGPRSRTRCA